MMENSSKSLFSSFEAQKTSSKYQKSAPRADLDDDEDILSTLSSSSLGTYSGYTYSGVSKKCPKVTKNVLKVQKSILRYPDADCRGNS